MDFLNGLFDFSNPENLSMLKGIFIGLLIGWGFVPQPKWLSDIMSKFGTKPPTDVK